MAFLVLGHHTGDDFADTSSLSNGLGGDLIVPGEHDHLNPHLFQFFYCPRAGLLDHIGHGDQSHDTALPGKIQGGIPLQGQLFTSLGQISRINPLFLHQQEIAGQGGFSLKLSFGAPSGQSDEILHWHRTKSLLARIHQHRFGQRVLRRPFQSGGQLQKFLLRNARGRNDLGHLGFSLGNGAGFVQHHSIHRAGDLQGLG